MTITTEGLHFELFSSGFSPEKHLLWPERIGLVDPDDDRIMQAAYPLTDYSASLRDWTNVPCNIANKMVTDMIGIHMDKKKKHDKI